MEKEKFVAMGLSDELLEKVSGGYTIKKENLLWKRTSLFGVTKE